MQVSKQLYGAANCRQPVVGTQRHRQGKANAPDINHNFRKVTSRQNARNTVNHNERFPAVASADVVA
jgi:hypothetical protein